MTLVCDAATLSLHLARVMLGKGAENLLVLSLSPGRTIFDWVVIANGRSERQVRTLADEVYHFCKRHRVPHVAPEGEAGWMVVDCIDVVVHAFVPELRDMYRLEELWPWATRIDAESALKDLPDPDRIVASAGA